MTWVHGLPRPNVDICSGTWRCRMWHHPSGSIICICVLILLQSITVYTTSSVSLSYLSLTTRLFCPHRWTSFFRRKSSIVYVRIRVYCSSSARFRSPSHRSVTFQELRPSLNRKKILVFFPDFDLVSLFFFFFSFHNTTILLWSNKPLRPSKV